MAYLIGVDEAAGKAVERVLREQNARVLGLLAGWESDPADAIHRARQGCKRARAVAQLLKPGAPYVAAVENAFYRDIQKRVAYARDAEALVEALDYLEVGVTEPRLGESVAMLRESMVNRALQNVAENRTRLRAQIESACGLLREADARLDRLPLTAIRRRDLRRGAERTWERCVTGFAQLRPDSTPGAFHAWRRRVKYASNQTQLLADLEPARAAIVGPRLRELAALLGHCQDQELLEALLEQQPDALRIDTHVHRLRKLIAISLVQLRHRALQVGRELFGDPVAGENSQARSPVTDQKYSRKHTATAPEEDAGSSPRPAIAARDPDSPRRWQSR